MPARPHRRAAMSLTHAQHIAAKNIGHRRKEASAPIGNVSAGGDESGRHHVEQPQQPGAIIGGQRLSWRNKQLSPPLTSAGLTTLIERQRRNYERPTA